MSKTYLPTSEQFDVTLSNIAKIAGVLGAKVDTSTWRGIQNAVKAGLAPQLFPIGTQLVVSHSVYGDMLYDVVAHDYFKSVDNENAHTMTLMCHDLLPSMSFNNTDAFYYAESELPAGTYNFTIANEFSSWSRGTYQFTLTQALPIGGQLAVSGYANAALTTLMVRTYANQTATTVTEESVITLGNDGTNLGTFGVELNHAHRVSYGSDNYKESEVRQFLNSSAEAGSVWTPQTKFDRPPSWVGSNAGFLNGLDNEFLRTVGKVKVLCSANNAYESPDSTVTKGYKYTVEDKFYIASQKEIFGTSTDVMEDNSVLFPFYKGAINSDRIKYKDGMADYWWTRSAHSWGANVVSRVNTNGSLTDSYVFNKVAIAPVCTIV